jgi:cytochrome b561
MRSRAVFWWRGLMIAGGFAFGLLADRRPFGETFLGHPIVVFAGIAGLGLLILRVVLRRPVPEIIPERAIVVGFLSGIAAFLVGNWIGVHLIVWR